MPNEKKVSPFQLRSLRETAAAARENRRDVQLAPDWVVDILDDLEEADRREAALPARIYRALMVEPIAPGLRNFDAAVTAVAIAASQVRSEYRKNTDLRDKLETLEERKADADRAIAAAVHKLAMFRVRLFDPDGGIAADPVMPAAIGVIDREVWVREGVDLCLAIIEDSPALHYPSQVATRLRELLPPGEVSKRLDQQKAAALLKAFNEGLEAAAEVAEAHEKGNTSPHDGTCAEAVAVEIRALAK